MIKKLVANSSFSLINNVLQLLVSLGSGMIIGRFLGAEVKGEVYLITQVYNMVQIVFSAGLGASLLYFLKRQEILPSQSITFIFLYCGLIAIFFSFLLTTFQSSLGNVFGGDIPFNYLVFSFGIALVNILSSFIGYAGMSEEDGIRVWSISSFLGNLVYLLILILVVFVLKLEVIGVIYALVGSSIIKLLLLAMPLYKTGFTFKPLDKVQTKNLLVYGFQLFISNLFLTSVFRIDTFFLNRMVDISQLGIYSVSVSVGELLLLIPSAIGVALFPHLSGLEREGQKQSMCIIGKVSFIIGFVGILGLALVGYPFILVVFGEEFVAAFVPFLILLPGLLAMTLNYSYSNYFSSIGQPLTGAYIFFAGLVVNIGLNLLLIPYLGITGAAVSSSISYVIITIGFILKIKKMDFLDLKTFVFPQKEDYLYVRDKVKLLLSK